MAFKDDWKDLVDGQSEILSEDINSIANEVILVKEEAEILKKEQESQKLKISSLEQNIENIDITDNFIITATVINEGNNEYSVKKLSASYEEIKTAYDENKNIKCIININSNYYILYLSSFDSVEWFRFQAVNEYDFMELIITPDISAFSRSNIIKEEDVMNYVTEREATYSNSLKGNISCETVNITDISPLTHNLKVTVTNESEVATTDLKVIKTGKNLASMFKKIEDVTIDDAVLIKKGTYKFSVKEVNTTYNAWRLQFKLFNTDGTLVENTTGANISIIDKYGSFYWYNSSGNRASFYMSINNHFLMTSGCDILRDFQFTLTFNDDYYVVFSFVNNNVSGNEATNLDLVGAQLETGDVATEYIPFTKSEYSVTVNGIVENVTPIYPVTYLYTKTPGVIINTEYNKDINKVIEELQQAIISLGGNI